MRRRYVLLLALAIGGAFWIAGIAVGYWVLPDDKKPTAECQLFESKIKRDDFGSADSKQIQTLLDYYNRNCR